MEKYCAQQGLPERGDIVFVAEALSQSQVIRLPFQYLQLHHRILISFCYSNVRLQYNLQNRENRANYCHFPRPLIVI